MAHANGKGVSNQMAFTYLHPRWAVFSRAKLTAVNSSLCRGREGPGVAHVTFLPLPDQKGGGEAGRGTRMN